MPFVRLLGKDLTWEKEREVGERDRTRVSKGMGKCVYTHALDLQGFSGVFSVRDLLSDRKADFISLLMHATKDARIIYAFTSSGDTFHSLFHT